MCPPPLSRTRKSSQHPSALLSQQDDFGVVTVEMRWRWGRGAQRCAQSKAASLDFYFRRSVISLSSFVSASMSTSTLTHSRKCLQPLHDSIVRSKRRAILASELDADTEGPRARHGFGARAHVAVFRSLVTFRDSGVRARAGAGAVRDVGQARWYGRRTRVLACGERA